MGRELSSCAQLGAEPDERRDGLREPAQKQTEGGLDIPEPRRRWVDQNRSLR